MNCPDSDKAKSVSLGSEHHLRNIHMFSIECLLQRIQPHTLGIPDVDQTERTAGMTSLTKGITSGAEKANVILGSTKYTIANYGSMGVWFSIGGI